MRRFKQCAYLATLSCFVLASVGTHLSAAVISVTQQKLIDGLSPYNWVNKDGFISSSVNGSSITLGFTGASNVALLVDTDHLAKFPAGRFPIIAWSVNGGALRQHQLVVKEQRIVLSTGVVDPVISLYIKGMSPFENRFTGDVPVNSVKIAGFYLDQGDVTPAPGLPDLDKVWLNIGDSILSGDAALGQGRPPDDLWAASEDGRASYGYLLAQHYGFREARIAYGGYNWAGGMAGVPGLSTVIDQKTSTVSRLSGTVLNPAPALAMINLGENGAPGDNDVIKALEKLRSRVGPLTRIVVMVPVSGHGRTEVTRAFTTYKTTNKDEQAYLIDLGQFTFATTDGQHPSVAGHQTIYEKALPAFDAIVSGIVPVKKAE